MPSGLAQGYSTVFTPEVFVLLCGVVLVGHEWRSRSNRDWRGLGGRLGVLGAGWLVGLAIYLGVRVLAGPVPKWVGDATGSIGLMVGLGIVWIGWRLQGWGPSVPPFVALLVAVSVPHLLITPFWDVSTHVLYAVVPAGALVTFDRRFAAFLLVPLGMVFARPLAGAHTWPQSVGGLVLGLAALLAFTWWVEPGRGRHRPRRAY